VTGVQTCALPISTLFAVAYPRYPRSSVGIIVTPTFAHGSPTVCGGKML